MFFFLFQRPHALIFLQLIAHLQILFSLILQYYKHQKAVLLTIQKE